MDTISHYIESFPQRVLGQQLTPIKIAVLILAGVLASGGIDFSQLAFAFIGACVYAAICTLRFDSKDVKQMAAKDSRPKKTMDEPRRSRGTAEGRRQKERSERSSWKPAYSPPQQQHDPAPLKQLSVQPVAAPTFDVDDFETQVHELALRLAPSAEGDKIVADIVALVQDAVVTIMPEAEVVGFACGDPRRGAAFAVAVPGVDIVVSASPEVLNSRLNGGKMYRGFRGQGAVDDFKLKKSALRTLTSELVSQAGFKFRRSAFRGQEPKTTLLAPPTSGCSDCIPMDLSVNSIAPLWHAALLTECGRIEPRAQALILLVRRWAKDRAICHVAKGHLPPQAWSLLVIFFLQVGVTDEGGLLPPLDSFEMASQIGRSVHPATRQAHGPPPTRWIRPAGGKPEKILADLLREFFHFYHAVFDWGSEAISIRAAARAAPNLRLPLHVCSNENGETEVGPSIEDPFNSGHNLGACTTSASCARLREELERAAGMCDRGEPLTQLLVPWVPPEGADTEAQQTLAQQDDPGHCPAASPIAMPGFEYQ